MTSRVSGDRRRALRRRLTAGFGAGLLALQTGCHTYLPVQERVPGMGHEVAIELNDRGRLLVVSQLGESVLRVDGTLVAATDSMVTMRVSRTVQIQGSSALWTGEAVTIPVEGIRGYRMREFSRGRSAAMAGGVLATLAVVAPYLKVIGGGDGRPGDGGCTESCSSIR